MGSIVLISADLVPTSSNINLFINQDIDCLLGDKLQTRLKNASFTIMNLEVPLTDTISPIRKCGPCLNAPTSTVKGIKKINPFFFTLANNHIMDQGFQGLSSTISVLTQQGIKFSGVGNNIHEARVPFIEELNGKRLGIYTCVEHEFSLATEILPGANPFDPITSFDDVRNLREHCDYLVVLYHGGKEEYRYPSPLLQKVFRKFADAGANLVIAQHTHCIGCKEDYNGSTLLYGQGNFLFDYIDNEFWRTSLLVELDLESCEIKYIPLIKNGKGVSEAEGEIGEQIIREFIARSKEITQVGFVENKYDEYASRMETEYLFRLSGRIGTNYLVRAINKLTSYKFLRWIYSDRYRVVIENIIECEAHRELAARIMRGK